MHVLLVPPGVCFVAGGVALALCLLAGLISGGLYLGLLESDGGSGGEDLLDAGEGVSLRPLAGAGREAEVLPLPLHLSPPGGLYGGQVLHVNGPGK